MRIERVQVRRAMRGEDAAAWARAIAGGAWIDGARVLKDEPGSGWARRAMVNGADVVVKCRLLTRPARRIKASFGHGQGDRQWRAAARLAMKRIACSRPVVLAHAEVDGRACELLVLRWASGRTVLEMLDAAARGVPEAPGVREQHEIARAVGATIPALLRARLHNRDHKPSNLVVDRDERGRVRITMIDLAGIRAYGWLGIDDMEGEQMAAALVIEPTGCGCRPRRGLWMRALRMWLDEDERLKRGARHEVLRAVIGAVAGLVAEHEDSRPRVDPLGRAAGAERPTGAG